MLRPLRAALLLLLCESAVHAKPCPDPRTSSDVVRCALDQSPDVASALAELQALAGRRDTARVLLPSNPVLSFVGAGRRPSALEGDAGRTFFNWYVTLSQELEVGGQRGARVAMVDAEIGAATHRLAVARQEVAAFALAAWFEVLATEEALGLALEVEQVAKTLADLAEARLKESLISPVDADLARSEAVRARLVRFEVGRRRDEARVVLAVLLGLDPGALTTHETLASQALADDLAAGEKALVERALSLRGEVGAAEMERGVAERRVSLLRRERVPNPTLSVFAQRDGLDEPVYGGGLSLPIPLPAPVGHTRAGEIAEATARVEQGRLAIDRVRRQVRAETARAFADYAARRSALSAIPPELLPRLRQDLAALAEGVTSRQLSIREALIAQRSLIETLQAALDAQLAFALAWVELHRAAVLPLPGADR
jgi:cobalt-zinc-cadmium efflux system outer membrane protein